MKILISFDIDGTLETGDPPGRVTMEMVRRAQELGYIIGSASDRPVPVQKSIWEKHGIRQAGFWTVMIGESNLVLYYLLAWESLAEREAKWNAFMADPEWVAARSESEKDGLILAKVTNEILQPTSFSSVK